MLFCKDCKHVAEDWICNHQDATVLRNIVTGNMPTCEDMRSNNGLGCGIEARWYEPIKPVEPVITKPKAKRNNKIEKKRGRSKSPVGGR